MSERHFYSLTSDYATDWQPRDGIREFVQNWFDGAVEKVGHLPVAKYSTLSAGGQNVTLQNSAGGVVAKLQFANKVLTLTNLDSLLTKDKILMMGNSTKSSDPRQIGKHGEGMKTGLVALIRSRCTVKITTPDGLWTFGLALDPKFEGLSVKQNLFADFSAGQQCRDVKVEICNLPTEQFVSDQFLFITPPVGDKFSSSNGTVYFHSNYKQKVYEKGVFVKHAKDMKLSYGFDADELALGRDRNMLSNDFAPKYMGVLSDLLCASEDDVNPDLRNDVFENIMNVGTFEAQHAERMSEEGKWQVFECVLESMSRDENDARPVIILNNDAQDVALQERRAVKILQRTGVRYIRLHLMLFEMFVELQRGESLSTRLLPLPQFEAKEFLLMASTMLNEPKDKHAVAIHRLLKKLFVDEARYRCGSVSLVRNSRALNMVDVIPGRAFAHFGVCVCERC